MKYLKIFHKYFILINMFLILGCVSEDRTIQIDDYDDKKGIILKNINYESDKSIDITLSIESQVEEIDNPAYSIDWTNPIADKDTLQIILPEISLENKTNIDTEKIGYKYVLSLVDNYYFGSGYIYEKNKILEKTSPVEPTSNEPHTEKVTVRTNNVLDEEVKKTEITERFISAPVFDKLDISLKGVGWIYLPEDNNKSVEYIGRKFTNTTTTYVFVPEEEGQYILNFQFQNLSSNDYIIERINLEILNNKPNLITSNLTDNIDIIVETDISILTDQVSLENLVKKMLQTDDCKGLAELIPELLDSDNPKIISLYPEITDCLYTSGLYVEAIQILEKVIKNEKNIISMDYHIYLLGKLYEQDSEFRNELISANYYKRLIDNFPVSIYWDESQNRYRYLKRRYIDIR